ncbi:MAG: magnesium transporter [Candidatus Paceibacteria bacterium]|jgi:magnesium transporter
MMYVNNYKNIEWIDLENPTQDEARTLVEKYNVDPLIADELLAPSARSRVDSYSDFIYLILHFPSGEPKASSMEETRNVHEVDFIIGKNVIITTRYKAVDELHEFSKVFEVNSILDRSDMGDHAGFVFFYMIQHFYGILNSRIENTRDLLNEIEERIFKGDEKEMVYELAKINWLLLTYKEALSLHKDVLESFEKVASQFFETSFSHHLKSIVGEYYRVQGTLYSAKEYLNELRTTNDTLLATKQNEIMKTLTVTTFVVLPLSLIAGIFGMNTESMPFIGNPDDFLIVLSIMLSLAILMFAFFRYKKWL